MNYWLDDWTTKNAIEAMKELEVLENGGELGHFLKKVQLQAPVNSLRNAGTISGLAYEKSAKALLRHLKIIDPVWAKTLIEM